MVYRVCDPRDTCLARVVFRSNKIRLVLYTYKLQFTTGFSCYFRDKTDDEF